MITFFVAGVPVPQGSKSAFVRGGRAVVVEGSNKDQRDRHAAWRADVARGASVAHNGAEPILGAVAVRLEFFMPLPKSDPYRPSHVSAPDLDKLIRNVLDALTNSGVIRDDSQVHMLEARKSYARYPATVGVNVEIQDQTAVDQVERERLKAAAKEKRRA